MGLKEAFEKNKQAIFVATIVFLIVLTAFTGYETGRRKVCSDSQGVLVTDTDTGREFCLIKNVAQIRYCENILENRSIPCKFATV